MNGRAAALLVSALVVAVFVWWLWPEPAAEPSRTEAVRTAFPALPGVDGAVAPRRDTDRPSDEEARRAVAEALREAIRQARDERVARTEGSTTAPTSPSPSGGTPTAAGAAAAEVAEGRVGTIDPQYIRDSVQALRPLLAECYELARAAAERDERPVPEGRLVTRFVFSGEPEVGGVVEESTVLDESSLRDPVLEECFSETLFTLELPPPDEGGTITVHYPFELSDEPDEAQ